MNAAGVRELAPLISAGYIAGRLLEPDARAIDVAELHRGYLRGVRRRGGRLITAVAATAITPTRGGWQAATPAGEFGAAILVDAAGAGADQIAAQARVPPLGLVPKRRTAILVDPPGGLEPAPWPMVIDVDEQFYVKPAAGQLLVSPADETPRGACGRGARGTRRGARRRPLRDPDRTARCARPTPLGGAAQLRYRPRPGGRARSGRAGLRLAGGAGRRRWRGSAPR